MAGPLVPRGNGGVWVLSVPVLFGGCPFQRAGRGCPAPLLSGADGDGMVSRPHLFTLWVSVLVLVLASSSAGSGAPLPITLPGREGRARRAP